MKILAVDDNADILGMMEMVVSSLGHQFESASGGRMGLGMIRKEKYDMVVLDLSMPDFTGLDVVDALAAEGILKRQPVILFTASYLGVSGTEEDIISKGVHSILPKPADIDKIMAKIAEIEAEQTS